MIWLYISFAVGVWIELVEKQEDLAWAFKGPMFVWLLIESVKAAWLL